MDREKFKSLVHYICWKCDDPSKLGATKLNKIVWYAEKTAFLRLGASMTGAKFVKREYGPVPAAIIPVLDELQKESAIVIRHVHLFDYPKKEYISLTEPNIDNFSGKEISILDNVIEGVCQNHTAATISNTTHDEIWDLAEIGEEIPLYAVLGKRAEICEEDIAWAKEQIASYA